MAYYKAVRTRSYWIGMIIFFSGLPQLLYAVTCTCQCLLTNNNEGPPFLLGGYGGEGEELKRGQQAIFTSYKLDCCGNITTWGIDVHPGNFRVGPEDRRGKYTIDFQVWRPSPTVKESLDDSGYYSLVGNNRFSAISNIVSPGVAIVSPSPEDYIAFQPGDVLGVFVEEASLDNDGVVMLTKSTFTNEVVWYGSLLPSMATSQNGGCPYSVGTDGVLNTSINAAPVISIATVTYPCFMATLQPMSPTLSNDLLPNTIGLSIATSLAALFAVIAILAVVVSLAMCLKRRNVHKRITASLTSSASTTHQSHAVHQSQAIEVNESDYDYPVVDPDNIHMVESTQNESYRVADREVEHQLPSEKHAYCNYPEVL